MTLKTVFYTRELKNPLCEGLCFLPQSKKKKRKSEYFHKDIILRSWEIKKIKNMLEQSALRKVAQSMLVVKKKQNKSDMANLSTFLNTSWKASTSVPRQVYRYRLIEMMQ